MKRGRATGRAGTIYDVGDRLALSSSVIRGICFAIRGNQFFLTDFDLDCDFD
jgi:hypothetical protein